MGQKGKEDESEEEDEDDFQELPFWRYFQYATVSAQRLLMFSGGKVQRMDTGVKFLKEVLANTTHCHNGTKQHAFVAHIAKAAAQSCVTAYADLLLMMKLLHGPNATEEQREDLQRQWSASQ